MQKCKINQKRNHHYVWQEYLRAWAANEMIWCNRNGNIFNAHLGRVASERDFYKANTLSDIDIAFVNRAGVYQSRDFLIEENAKVLKMFLIPQRIEAIVEKRHTMTADIQNCIEIIKSNLEEEMHSAYEIDGIHCLRQLINGELSFLESNSEFVKFSKFLCAQYLRTPKTKDRFIEAVRDSKFAVGVNLDAVYNVLRHIWINDMTAGMILNQKIWKITILENHTGVEFITTDQPIINVLSPFLNKDHIPKSERFFYPISPVRAAIIHKNEDVFMEKHIDIDSNEVEKYNQIMKSASSMMIFSRTKAQIERC